jgi:protein TonB
MKWGAIIGMCGAIALHIVGATEASRLANGLGMWALERRAAVSAYLSKFYDIEMINPPPPPPPVEEKPPEEEAPKPVAAVKAPSHEREAPPPAPAQAGKILTQEPDPNEPVDLTGQGFVTGNADTYAGGVTASSGTSKTAVRELNAVVGGVPGGTGTKVGAVGPDLSRPPGIVGGSQWDCPFPPEADAEEINYQRVKLLIVVRPDGTPQDAKVIGDPGNGFGREARKCALTRRYEPALDREGRPVSGTIPQVNITFQR